MIALSYGRSEAAIPLIMILIGITHGAASSVHASLMAELFGTRHLGAVRALGHALMVGASAAGPGIVGLLLDRGVAFETQCLWMAAYAAGLTLLFAAFGARLRDPQSISRERPERHRNVVLMNIAQTAQFRHSFVLKSNQTSP